MPATKSGQDAGFSNFEKEKVPATKSGQNREEAGNLPAFESTLNQSRALAAGSFSGCFSPGFREP